MAENGRQRAQTLHELLEMHGIELHEPPRAGFNHGGSRSRLFCPQCHGGQRREKNFYVLIDPDMKGATWQCYRQENCRFIGGGRIADAPLIVQKSPKPYRTPKPIQPPPPADRFLDYFDRIGIGEQTVKAFNLFKTRRKMPVFIDGKQSDEEAERDVIAYPYYDNGELVNVKYKAVYNVNGKRVKRFKQEFHPKPTLYNIDAFTDPEGMAVMLEGEDDVLIMADIGWQQVTTLADGSPGKVSERYDPDCDTDKRYAALRNEPRIARISKWILAGDNDKAGDAHMEEVARRLGKWRCWRVTWPDGCKDAKEVAQRFPDDYIERIHQALENASPYPLEGVDPLPDQRVLDIQAGRIGRRWLTGIPKLDERVSLNDDGQLIVTTGVPGHGKSSYWHFMGVAYAERWQIDAQTSSALQQTPFHTVVFSGETEPARVALDLIAMHSQKPAFWHDKVPYVGANATRDEFLPWVRKHFTFIRWDDKEEVEVPVSWMLATIREIVRAKKAKLVLVDPMQEIDFEIPDNCRNESRWIGKMVGKFRALAYQLGVNIVLVVHPTKRKRVDGKMPIPMGDDIADSRFYYTKAHIGLTVHRPDLKTDETELHCWKSKDSLYSATGMTPLRFNKLTRRYLPIIEAVDNADDAIAGDVIGQGRWK